MLIYAVHPNLLGLRPMLTLEDWTGRFHGRPLLHAAHALMTLAVPLLVVAAFHFAAIVRGRGAWFGFVGGAMAVLGCVILAADKGALCLTASAFDTLTVGDYAKIRPALIVMHERAGWLSLLWLLPLLPVGFAIQGIGVVRERLMPTWRGTALVTGALLLANPDIELISLLGSVLIGVALVPYGWGLLRSR